MQALPLLSRVSLARARSSASQAIFKPSLPSVVVCYKVVLVGALRDDTKNGCAADYVCD